MRLHRGSSSKRLATTRGNSMGAIPRLTNFSSAMAACSPMSCGSASYRGAMESFAARYSSTYPKSPPRKLPMKGREYSPSSCALQVSVPAPRRPVVLPRLREMRAVHPLRHHLSVDVGVGQPDAVRLGQRRRRRRAHLADGIGNLREFAGQDRCGRLVNLGHRAPSLPQQVRVGLPPSGWAGDVSPTPVAGSLPSWMKC